MDRIQYLQKMQVYDPESIPDNELKLLRVSHGLSQRELAKIVGTDHNQIGQTEIGMLSATFEGKWKTWVEKAARYFSMLPEDIFPREVCKLGGFAKEDLLQLSEVHLCGYEFDYEMSIDGKMFWKNIKQWVKQREYQSLYYYFHEGLTLKETAEKMGWNHIESPRQAIAKGFKRIRKEKKQVEYLLSLYRAM